MLPVFLKMYEADQDIEEVEEIDKEELNGEKQYWNQEEDDLRVFFDANEL